AKLDLTKVLSSMVRSPLTLYISVAGMHGPSRLICVCSSCHSFQLWLSVSRCVPSEDQVALFNGLVAGKAFVEICLGARLAVLIKLREPPAPRRGILFCVLDHKLQVPRRGGPGHERLGPAKDFVVLLRRDVVPGYTGNDGAVRERELPFAIGLDRDVVAQNAADIIEVACFVGHRDQYPVAVSGGNVGYEDRSGLLIGLSRGGAHGGDHAGECCNCNQHYSNPFHHGSSCTYLYAYADISRPNRGSRRGRPVMPYVPLSSDNAWNPMVHVGVGAG